MPALVQAHQLPRHTHGRTYGWKGQKHIAFGLMYRMGRGIKILIRQVPDKAITRNYLSVTHHQVTAP